MFRHTYVFSFIKYNLLTELNIYKVKMILKTTWFYVIHFLIFHLQLKKTKISNQSYVK